MRTNIGINDDLLEEAFSVSASRTKKGLIHEALRELIRIRKIKDLTDLAGQIEFHKGFNHKKLRSGSQVTTCGKSGGNRRDRQKGW